MMISFAGIKFQTVLFCGVMSQTVGRERVREWGARLRRIWHQGGVSDIDAYTEHNTGAPFVASGISINHGLMNQPVQGSFATAVCNGAGQFD
jgi:hypothetical protein